MMNFESKKGAWHDQTMKKKNKKRIYYHQNNILEKLKPKNQNLKTILIPVIQQKNR